MGAVSPNFLKIEIGAKVARHGEPFEITHLVSVDCVLGRNCNTKEIQRLRVEDLTVPVVETLETPLAKSGDLLSYSDEAWEVAQRRFAAIKPLLDDPFRTRAQAEALAKNADVHVGTLYKWLKLYLDDGHVSALVPEKVGVKQGTKRLTEEQEEIISSVLEEKYLHRQRLVPADICEEVKRRCRLAKVTIPHDNTVRRRIRDINPAHALRRRGLRDKARDLYRPLMGEFPNAETPWAVIQIDHTEADIILVDDELRLPLARPWLTLAIDVFSRMVVGLYLSFEKPSAASVGMCLSHAMCKKNDYLKKLGVEGSWPVWGVPAVVHADNAREFRGAVLRRAAEQYNIDLQWRMVGSPHYGGHIERYMGIIATKARKLPGATFNAPWRRKGYNSEKESALTLKEFEREVVEFLVNQYHQKQHSMTLMPPIKRWQQGIYGEGSGTPVGIAPVPADPERIRLDFMPFESRSVQPYGLQIDHVRYYHEVLDPLINAMDPDNPRYKAEIIVRCDPRDMSCVYYFDPLAQDYVAIPYRNRGYPAASRWELTEARNRLAAEGRKDIDEDAIFASINVSRERIAEAEAKTKKARKQAHRIKQTQALVAERSSSTDLGRTSPVENLPDIFSAPVKKISGAKLL